MKDNKILKLILKDLQNLNEKKKNKSKKNKKIGLRSMPADNNPEVTKMDFMPKSVIDKAAKEKDLDEKSKKSKAKSKKQVKHDPDYSAPEGSKRDKLLDRARRAYQRGDVAAAAKIRKNMEKPHMAESKQINELNELLNDMIEEQLLEEMINDLENHLEEKRKRNKKHSKKRHPELQQEQ